MELQINDYIECDEKILFKGTYNINDLYQTEPSIITINVNVENNPNGYNLLVDNFYNTANNLTPPTEFLLETITLSSYIHNTFVKNGQIQYTSFYKNDSSQNSAETKVPFVLYDVNSSNGIYCGVTKVLLNAIFDQRILYFIGKDYR